MRVLDVAPPPTTQSKPSRLGDLLVAGGVITPQQLKEALDYQRVKGGRLGVCLIKLGYLTEDILHTVLSRQFGIDLVDPVSCDIEPEVLKLLPRDKAIRLQVMPIRREDGFLFVAMADPNDVVTLDELRFRTGLKIKPLLASEVQIREG